jgi:F0F1-type ATP synthase assembly protein I
MGGALLAVAYLFVRTNSRRRTAVAASQPARYARGSGGDVSRSRLAQMARTPTTWYVGFVLAVLVVGAAGIVSVGGTAFSGSAGTVAALSLAALVALYLFLGTYATAKSRGRPESLAVAEGIGVIGGLALLGIVLVLVIG